MNAEFEALKARFKQKVENSGKKQQFNSDIYPHWNIGFGEEVIIRILQDSNPDNENVFFVEKCIHTLSVNGKDRNVLCVEKHYGEKCPICELSRKYYKAKDKETGLYYYNKKKYLLKALVIKDPLPPDQETKETAVNKVKVFQMNKKLLDKIMLEIASELDAEPWNLKKGYDFKIKKIKGDGGNPDYLIGSGFVRQSTAIPQEIVDSFEPTNLSALIPANPTLEVVQRMLNSHLTGDDSEENRNDNDDSDDGEEHNHAPVTQSPKTSSQGFGEDFVSGLEQAKAEGDANKAQSQAKVETPKAAEQSSGALDEDEDAIFQRILARKNAAKANAA